MTHLSGLESESDMSEVSILIIFTGFVLTDVQDETKVSVSDLGKTGVVALSSSVLHDVQVKEMLRHCLL